MSEESAKQTAADYNEYGQVAKKYGIKIMFHNHVEHFELLQDSQSTLFDVFLSETDPDIVAMELDIGATAIAGRSIPDLIEKYPGRFPVWDINDAVGIKIADASPGPHSEPAPSLHIRRPRGAGRYGFQDVLR